MGSSPIRNQYHNGKQDLHSIHSHKFKLQPHNPRNKRMRRRSPRSRSKQRTNATRTRSKRSNTKTTNAAKNKKLSVEQIKEDKFEDIINSMGGRYHCRICDQMFTTKSSRGFTSQWNHHRDSAKHQANREALLQQLNAHRTDHCNDISSNNEDDDDEESENQRDHEAQHTEDSDEYKPEEHHIDTEEEGQDEENESADEQEQEQDELLIDNKNRAKTHTKTKHTVTESTKTAPTATQMKPIKNGETYKRKRKRIKLTVNKHKNRVTAHCPMCNAAAFVQCSGPNTFQLRQAVCPSAKCGEFWVQIRDNKQVICTKQYPFSSDIPQQLNMAKTASPKKLTLTLNRKRKKPEAVPALTDRDEIVIESSPDIQIIPPPHKKRRTTTNQNTDNASSRDQALSHNHNHNDNRQSNDEVDEEDESRVFKFEHVLKQDEEQHDAYYDSDTGLSFVIPPQSETHDTQSAETRDTVSEHVYGRFMPFNILNQAYRSKMSHIEMVSPCTRSNCSDFIGGDSHCWIAAPLMLPGNIRMADIGYLYECCWCGKEVQFVEECASNTAEHHTAPQNETEDGDQFGVKAIAHQSRNVHASLLAKWKSSENIPVFPVDGPSYSRVPFSLDDLQIRDRIMASDGTNWLPGWIEQIDQAHNKVLVHFKGWNSRWDKWYSVNSGMLKTINEYRKEKKLHSATRNEGIYEIMYHKYPNFAATTVYEEQLNAAHGKSSQYDRHQNQNRKQKQDESPNESRYRRRKRRDKEEMDTLSSSNEDSSNNNHNDDNEEQPEIIDAEIVMMHDKSEVYMAAHELPIHDAHNFILCPPLFYSCTSTQTDPDKCITELVRNCFIHLRGVLENDADIQLIYKVCESKIEHVFYTLHCLKRPERVQSYLKLLKQKL